MAKDIDPDEDRSEELETGFENQNLSEGEEGESDLEMTENPNETDEEGGVAETGT